MRKQILLLTVSVSFTALLYGQVGINTTSPKSTLDVMAKNTDGSSPEGIIAPRLTRDALFAASGSGQYGTPQNGAIVYVTEVGIGGSNTGQTANVDAIGYYFFDARSDQWKKVGDGSNIYNADGILSSPRIMTMNGNSLGFVGGKIGIGSSGPHPSSILGLESTTLGFLPPRMTKLQMDAIVNPSLGLVVYCTDCFAGNQGCLMINDSSLETSPKWGSLCSSNVSLPIVMAIDCGSAATSGSLNSGVAASGVITTIPYNGGNAGSYQSVNFYSTGVTGLVASLSAGTLNAGNGSFTFNIVGTPNSVGTAVFDITVAGKSCSFGIPVTSANALVGALDCSSALFSPAEITAGTGYSGTMTLPYSGGNGNAYPQVSFVQNGLTFTLPGNNLSNGNGNLVYNVTGTASNAGTMSIPVSFGGKSCNVSTTVEESPTVVMPGNPQAWMRHNLGADTSQNADVPVQAIHGNYYQWGRINAVANASTPATAIIGWNTTPAPNGSWSDTSKTVSDPCPVGFKVPTKQQWINLNNSTSKSNIGTFTDLVTNFGSAKVFTGGGNKLTLPTAGARSNSQSGALVRRGLTGGYWSSTISTATFASFLNFNTTTVDPSATNERLSGFSVRCISE